jgi:hypothetical protein
VGSCLGVLLRAVPSKPLYFNKFQAWDQGWMLALLFRFLVALAIFSSL